MSVLTDHLAEMNRQLPELFPLPRVLEIAVELAGVEKGVETPLLGRLAAALSTCRACGRCAQRTHALAGEGPTGADLFVIGDGPTWVDDRSGLPLTGLLELKASRCASCRQYETCYQPVLAGRENAPAPDLPCQLVVTRDPETLGTRMRQSTKLKTPGALFSAALRAASQEVWRGAWETTAQRMRRFEVSVQDSTGPRLFVTGAVRCWHPDPRDPSSAKAPTREEIEACRPWLAMEHRLVGASVTVALGRAAAMAVLGRDVRLADVRGKDQEVPGWGPVFLDYSPAYALRLAPESAAREAALTGLKETLAAAIARATALRTAGKTPVPSTTSALPKEEAPR